MTLDQLIILCKEQDPKGQGELYRRYNRILFAICLRYSPSFKDAEDNLQDAFLTVFRKIGQFKGEGSFEGWMKRIAVNTVLQKYRKKNIFEIVNEERLEDEEDIETPDEEIPLSFLLKIIQELPDRYRLVFSMYVLDGYSHKEIAQELEISDGTSKSNLARARAILKAKIDSYKLENDG